MSEEERRRTSPSPEREAPLPEIAEGSTRDLTEVSLNTTDFPTNADSGGEQETEEPTTADPKLLEPDLDEIPKLLLVELQDEDADKAGNAMKKLSGLVVGFEDANKKNREEIKRIGGHALVIAVMKRYQHNERVQTYGCQFLQWNIPDSKTASMLAQMGVLEALANAMVLFPDSEELHLYSCNAIHLLLSPKKGIGRWGPRFVFDLGGISLVLGTMQRFPKNTMMIQQCCLCFQKFLLFGAEAKDALRRGGVAILVASAVENHPQHVQLQKYISEFIVQFFSEADPIPSTAASF